MATSNSFLKDESQFYGFDQEIASYEQNDPSLSII
jgi:hypothetical protein